MAELVDALHSKCNIERCVGSSPTSGTDCLGSRSCRKRLRDKKLQRVFSGALFILEDFSESHRRLYCERESYWRKLLAEVIREVSRYLTVM